MIDWRHWHNEPWLIGGLVLLGWLWAVLAGPWRTRLLLRAGASEETVRATAFPRAQAFKFYGALLTFYFAVGSPLDQIAERYLFSAHMLQHQLLIYPAALLFLLGLPNWMIDPVLGLPAFRSPLRVLFNPIFCGGIYTLVLGLWHRPDFYEVALQNKLIHVAEHVMFFGVALLYWWPVVSPSRVFPRQTFGTQMLYLLGVLIAMTPVFAYITFAQDILYPTYEFAPRLFPAFTVMDDQLLAGVGMKIVGMLVAISAFGVSFFRWYEEKK